MDRKTWASLISAVLALSMLGTTTRAADAPERSLKGHSLVSTHDPKVSMDLPASAAYVGSARWTLMEYADEVELFAFVDADKAKQVQRLYWLQFEAYLPSRPELHHTYDSKRHATLGGMDFLVDTWVSSTGSNDEPDSDSAHLHGLLVAHGYTRPASMLTVRFVHLMEGSRKELMFIYSEPIPSGYTAEEIQTGGVDAELWPFFEKGLIERAEKSIQFHMNAR